MNTIFKAYKSFWVKAFDFKGITNRKEYGLIFISNIFFTLIFIVLMIFFLSAIKLLLKFNADDSTKKTFWMLIKSKD